MTLRNDLTTQPTHILLPLGLLLSELNHGLSVKAFTLLASKENKTFDLGKVLPLILAEDRKLKAGGENGLTETQFIAKLRDIFTLTVATDDEIRHAWNAMLGDLSKLKAALDDIIKHADMQVILLSGTNPIHLQAIHQAVSEEKCVARQNPLSLNGLPLYVSFLQTATDFNLRCQDTHLIEEALADAKLEPANTLLVVSLTSQSPLPTLKAGHEANEKKRKEWAEKKGLHVVDYQRQNDLSVADAIGKYLATLAPQHNPQISTTPPKPGLFQRRKAISGLAMLNQEEIHVLADAAAAPQPPSPR